MMDDNKWMAIAIEQAKKASQLGEVPVGAVLILNDKLVAQAHNQPISTNDPTAHAEIQLLRIAGMELKNYRLPNSTLYVTLEPCAMCLGAMIHARVSRVVFGAYDEKTGVCGSCADLSNSPYFNHSLDITGGVLAEDCKNLLQDFFIQKRGN
ncbi:MAG: tRNA adenosine(34) deaminase TadA [Gammaproteobacteria bacterium]|nr:tRNA adenosine(34) deaminase TadA [Gammaproteobacteria bacterium]